MTNLNSLPPELSGEICGYLGTNDLLALRTSSKYYSRVTVTELSKTLSSKLRSIEVVITPEGLKTIRGLCQIPEFLRRMEHIGFAAPKHARALKSAFEKSILLLSAHQHNHFNMMERAQRLFEATGEAYRLLRDIFMLMKTAAKLTACTLGRIGWRRGSVDGSHACGLPALIRDLHLTKASIASCLELYGEGATREEMCDTLSIVAKVLGELSYEEKSVTLHVNYDGSHSSSVERGEGASPWGDFRHLKCIKEISVFCAGCPADEGYSSHLDSVYLLVAKQIPAIVYGGCMKTPRRGCSGFSFISSLNTTHYPCLTHISLYRMTMEMESMRSILKSFESRLKAICLGSIFLTSGTWTSVFSLMEGMSNLKTMRLISLKEYPSHNSVQSWGQINNEDLMEDVQIKGQARVKEYLMLLRGEAISFAGVDRKHPCIAPIFLPKVTYAVHKYPAF
ncbi:hypothetical protein BDV96DRAFT_602451 [Lophiotrema nucula]|uniref:F-box domain-containing protein n=1 Tax=Lophiotrema nucula TaxID=690887 RepID=A0A6A5YYK9_9PLEO|nr:hypothetical protein BDV96DRAFT_602451 [Lophiotrema nucula]